MRVLLVAYDFPPNPSPQSLRWTYLVRELAALECEIRVITVDLPGYGPGGLPAIPDNIRVHRVFPGLFTAALLHRRRRRLKAVSGGIGECGTGAAGGASHQDMQRADEVGAGVLNWKGRLAERIKKYASLLLFPDYRAEWLPWARRCLRDVLEDFKPDVVVTSHEPACSLPLGLEAKRLGFCWIADLGDPILAAYTPRRWRLHAGRLERRVCRQADLISVTNRELALLLVERHGMLLDCCFVLPQGYDSSQSLPKTSEGRIAFRPDALELLYAGRLYSFRRIDSLLKAVINVPGVRLSIATPSAPDAVLAAVGAYPDSVRLLGYLPHSEVLGLQRNCDILVNLANADPVQVPGKVSEYLGAGKPILHMRAGRQDDAVGELIRRLRAGWSVEGTRDAIEACLRNGLRLKERGELFRDDRDTAAIAAYSWRSLAAEWRRNAECLVANGPQGAMNEVISH